MKRKTKEEREMVFYFVLPDKCDSDINNAPENLQIAYNSYCQHWDKGIDKHELILESVISKLKKNEVDSKAVYIFSRFEGDAFENLKKTNAKIYGTKCLLDCLTNNIKFPATTPVFSLAMNNMFMSLSGVAPNKRVELRDLISYMGGIYYEDLNSACTHLVAGNVCSKKYEIAATRKLKIMHFNWVYEVWKENLERNCYADDHEFEKYKLKVFYTLGITSTGLSIKEREQIKELVTLHGGSYDGAFSSEKTHILILKKKSVNSQKFVSAIKFKKECLTPNWVYDSIKQGYALPFQGYRVSSLKNSTPEKDFMQASSRDFNPNSTELSEISNAESLRNITINETPRNLLSASSVQNTTSSSTISSRTRSADSKQSEPNYKAILGKINVIQSKKYAGYLDGCKIYLSGFNADAKDKLIKILNKGGAIRFDELNDQVTHVIVGKYVTTDMQTIQEKKLQPLILTLDWLVESSQRKEPAPTDDFIFRETIADESGAPEQPSPASKKAILSMNHSFKRPPVPPKLNLPSTSKERDQPSISSVTQQKMIQADPENHLVHQYLDQNATVGNGKHTIIDTEDVSDLDYLKNKTIFLFGFSGKALNAMILECESAQGTIVDEHFQGVVDLVITPDKMENLQIPVKYKCIASELLIETAIQLNKIPEKLEYFHHPIMSFGADDPRPLKNDIISYSTYSGPERVYISNLAQILGAKESETFAKKDLPILIVPRPEGKKYTAAKKWGGTAVTAQWLVKCYKTKSRVSFENYNVECPIANEEEEDESDGLTLKQAQDMSSTLKDAVEIPSINADKINLLSQHDLEVPDVNKDKDFHEFVNDFDKFSQDVLREKDNFVIKHRRLSELRTETPISKKRTASSSDTPTNNVSQSNIDDLDLETPVRNFVKKALREEKDKDTPKTKRLKQIMITTPEIPESLKIPDSSSVPGLPDDTPKTRIATKRKLDVLGTYYSSPKERKKSTPFSEIRRRFWKQALGDDYESETGDTQEESMMKYHEMSPNENSSPENDDDEGSFSENIRKNRKKPNVAIPVASTSKGIDIDSIINSPDALKDSGLYKVANFIKTRVLNESKKKSEPIVAHPRRMLEEATPMDDIDSEVFSESQNYDVGWKTRAPPKPSPVRNFMFTTMSDENKLRSMKYVEELKANFLNITAGFDSSCTHLVFERPNRGEKVMSAIAAGRWCLIPKYLEDSHAAGKFLAEADYEWGNPEAKHKLPLTKELEESIAKACHYWRVKSSKNDQKGAFQNFKVILHVNKHEAFKNIIQAGGGTVLDVSMPYYKSQTALQASHCFVDSRSSSMSDIDMKALKEAGVHVLTISYINAYLCNEKTDPNVFSTSASK